MPDSRRDFLKGASAGLLATAAGCHREPAVTPHPTTPAASATPAAEVPAGMPPAFGTAPAVGPHVSEITFLESSRLVQITMPEADRALAASNWRSSMAPLYERRTGPRKVALPPAVVPYSVADPVHASGAPALVLRNQFVRSRVTDTPLPADDAAIAFAPVHQLSRWIEHRHLTSERLTEIYLARIARFDPKLRCIITLTRDHALEQARAADKLIAAGHYKGPLHGIPWGAKDLLDTAGIPTTWGAEPYRHRVPTSDAIVTQRLNAAGAVLIAKLSLGALALNDVWFGGQTMNPWLLEEGSSGSSAGPGAATAAGLVGFAIGSETGGSIVSPSMRCGVTGLRPTFGRVARTGAMTLCWSLDKLGPMARSVEDTLLVLNSITGPDPTDPSSVPSHLDFQATAPVTNLRVGYFPQWMKEAPATDVDRHALEVVRSLGMTPVEVHLPDWPYDSLQLILFAEAAAAFEDLTASGHDHDLRMQVADAWPNSFRQARFLSAVDLVQADRLRRRVALEMARLFAPSHRRRRIVCRGIRLRRSRRRPPPRPLPPRRDAHHHQLHRPPLAHPPRRLRGGLGGPQRLGPRPRPSTPHLLAPTPRPPRHHPHRPTLRRRHHRPSRPRPRTSLQRRRRKATQLLTAPTPSRLIILSEAEESPHSAPRAAQNLKKGISRHPGTNQPHRIVA